jgi:ubiquinone/menaquinone biosynthesis C-methylase UbiE
VSDSHGYPLGYSAEEARRLTVQAAMLEDLTADLLRRAGLAPGMRVLDLGCGVGDVSMLAARIVGQSGSVLGVDRAASSLELARHRASALHAGQVRFLQAELDTFATKERFDALVGRLVLLYLPEPAAILRRLVPLLDPGGIVAFQEYDMSQSAQSPPSTLFMQVRRWLLDAFVAGGAELDMGTKLYSAFVRAGLPSPTMIAASRVECGPTTQGYEYFTSVLRSLLPLIERSGIASAEQVGIDTLAQRMREDAVRHERVLFPPRVVGAWSRIPSA